MEDNKIDNENSEDIIILVDDDDDDFFKEFEYLPRKGKKCQQNVPEIPQDLEQQASKVLDPDHPLLERFQKALKEHLSKQITRLKEEVAELEIGTKKVNAEKEDLGVQTYECHQLVIKQQKEIDECVKELETITSAKEQAGYELEGLRKKHKEEKNKLLEAEKKEIELRNEVESVNLLLDQMKKWEEDIESELVINQRIAEKTRKDKLRLAIEKKEQDAYLYKLMTEVWRLEGALETAVMQLRVKEEDRENLAEQLFLSNMDIEASEADQRCLMHGWQGLLITITNKDKLYNKKMQEFRKLEESYNALQAEIVQVKKLANKEILKNETLTVFKERIEGDIKIATKLLNVEIDKRKVCEKQFMQYESMLEQIEKDIEKVKMEESEFITKTLPLKKEFDNLMESKRKLEELIVATLQDRLLANKTSISYQKHLDENKEKTRSIKITLQNLECSIAVSQNEASFIYTENVEITQSIEELQKTIALEDAQLLDAIREKEKCVRDLDRKLRTYEVLRKRLDKYIKEHMLELSPHQLKINNLKGQIRDLQDKNKEMETFWLREQAIVVDLSEKRQAQIKELNLLKKQVAILDQKYLKLNDELENYKILEDVINRSINILQNKLSASTDSLNKKRGNKETIDNINNTTQIELLDKLEEAELNCLKLKAEIADLEEDKLVLSKELIEKNREMLCWEKKIKMALEARKDLQKELSEDGEIGKMKAEIHRMNVRYSQLKKVQEKLIQDLEHCVVRRESIVTVSEAKTKLVKGGFQQARLSFNRKLDDIRNKIRQTQNDKDNLERKIEMKEHEIDQLGNELNIAKEDFIKIDEEYKTVHEIVEKMKLDKQLNLDILLFKQRKLKVYAELSRGRLPYTVYKSPASAHQAYEHEKEMNSKLRIIVENLLSEHPDHVFILTRAHNSLVLPALNL